MVSTLLNFWLSFLAGLFIPLGAVCVLPLYPGFLAYLAGQVSQRQVSKTTSKKLIFLFGVIVTGGVLISMFLVGLIFTFFLQESLTKAIGIISPIAFAFLAVVSLLLIFNFDFGKYLPKKTAPVLKNPYWSSLVFGLFFGIIVLPCNPAGLAILFAVSTTTLDFFTNLLHFLFFGLGMALPLLLLAAFSAVRSQQVIGWLNKHQRKINLVAGILMLTVSLYYLVFVFKVV